VDFYIPEDGILRSHRRENLKSYNTDLNFISESVFAKWMFKVNTNIPYKPCSHSFLLIHHNRGSIMLSFPDHLTSPGNMNLPSFLPPRL
jgi:hypothetical protein